MTIDEPTRLNLLRAFEDLIGPELASAAMEAMPNLDYQQLATHADLAELRLDLRGEIAELRVELKTEMAELRTELKTEMAELRGDLRSEMAANVRLMVLSQLGTAIALAGLMIRLA